MRTLTVHRDLLGVAALLFTVSAAVTAAWCGSMAAMPGMDMPGGWTMSMAWMRMPGQGWPGAAATFLGMWTVMMIAMMLPALLPVLMRHRESIGGGSKARRDALTARVAAGYFLAWTGFGAIAWAAGVALAAWAMRVPAIAAATPLAGGVTLVLAGLLQSSAWKTRRLERCSQIAGCCGSSDDTAHAWRLGVRCGVHCLRCCAPLTAALFVLGVMDLFAMTLVTALITAERLASRGALVARISGVSFVFIGAWMIAMRA